MDKLFNGHRLPVADINGMDGALRRIANKGIGFIVPGRLLDINNAAGIRRLTYSRKDSKATLESVARPWLLFDLDGVPNVSKLDPVQEPEAARAWLLSLLPEAVRAADTIVRWSSSQSVGIAGPPQTLSVHVWSWLSEALSPEEAKEFMARADLHARRVLETMQPSVLDQLDAAQPKGRRKRVVDPKITEAQQPIYVAPPLLADGIADPFTAEQRQVLVRGEQRAVNVDALREELAGVRPSNTCVLGPRRSRERKASGSEIQPARPSPKRPVLSLGDGRSIGSDHPFIGEILRLIRQAVAAQTGKRAADRVFGMGRMAAEIVRLVIARTEWGRTHSEFGAWSAAGGVPDGERDTWLFGLAKCLAHAVPASAVLDGTLAGLLIRLGNALCSEMWTADQWQRGGYGKSVLEKARAAARGETESWQGEASDARYRVSAARLRRDLCIGDDEIRALRLLSLADGALEKANRRALAASVPSRKRCLTPEKIVAERATVVALRGEGRSLREIVRETGIPVASVQRIAATAVRGDPICPTDLESKKEEERESTSSESVQAAQGGAADASVLPKCREKVFRIPGFILRARAEREAVVTAAATKAERYIQRVGRLTVILAKRRSAPLDELPSTPCLDHLTTETVAAVLAAQNALHTAQRRVVRKVETAKRRKAAQEDRDAFWAALERKRDASGAEVVEEAERRLAGLADHWQGRGVRAWSQWKLDGEENTLRHVIALGNAKRSVLNAEKRRFALLKQIIAA